jgi:hypothetical protein
MYPCCVFHGLYMFPITVIISTFLLHMMYRQIQGNIKHVILLILINSSVCIEFYVAHLQTKLCQSCPHLIQD